MRNAEWGMRSAECGVWSAEFGISSAPHLDAAAFIPHSAFRIPHSPYGITAVGTMIASFIPWSSFLSGGQTVARAPRNAALPSMTK
ncbi:hypothetical protein EV701_11742 [Chthoniobacter flavus]|nr:hypothetical protein EV701_11742 [Chthoniobacter flavus]